VNLRQRRALGALRDWYGLEQRVAAYYERRARAIRRASAAGLTPTEIADALGVRRQVVYRALEPTKGS
jgi:DNA invertase Pin-like site-specific DNA recombinase